MTMRYEAIRKYAFTVVDGEIRATLIIWKPAPPPRSSSLTLDQIRRLLSIAVPDGHKELANRGHMAARYHLKPEPCEICGHWGTGYKLSKEPKTRAHHGDYTKPLDIHWLCESCHRYLHHHKMPDGTIIPESLQTSLTLLPLPTSGAGDFFRPFPPLGGVHAQPLPIFYEVIR